MTLQELYDRRAQLVAEARKYNDDHAAEWNDERQVVYDRMMAEVDSLTKQIQNREQLEAAEKREKELLESRGRQIPGGDPSGNGGADLRATATPEYRAGFERFLRTGNPAEIRAMNVSVDPSGGYLTADEFNNSIVSALAEYLPLRQYATVITTDGDRNIPTDGMSGVAYWIGEEEAYQEAGETVGLKVLSAHKLSYLQKVSEELVADARFDIFAFLTNAYGRAFSASEEAGFTTGNGVGRPTGFINDAQVGKTTAANNAMTSDEIIDVFYSLKAPYRRRATWMMADSIIATVRKMKGTDGQYIWQPSLAVGQPDTILGRPVAANNSMDALAAGAKVAAIGDFSFYWIADRGNITVQRLNELYAATGQVGFRAFKRTDGRLTVAEAVKVLQIKA